MGLLTLLADVVISIAGVVKIGEIVKDKMNK